MLEEAHRSLMLISNNCRREESNNKNDLVRDVEKSHVEKGDTREIKSVQKSTVTITNVNILGHSFVTASTSQTDTTQTDSSQTDGTNTETYQTDSSETEIKLGGSGAVKRDLLFWVKLGCGVLSGIASVGIISISLLKFYNWYRRRLEEKRRNEQQAAENARGFENQNYNPIYNPREADHTTPKTLRSGKKLLFCYLCSIICNNCNVKVIAIGKKKLLPQRRLEPLTLGILVHRCALHHDLYSPMLFQLSY